MLKKAQTVHEEKFECDLPLQKEINKVVEKNWGKRNKTPKSSIGDGCTLQQRRSFFVVI